MSKPVYFDEERAKRLYDEGMNDAEIARELNVPHHTIGNWRRRTCLLSATEKRKRINEIRSHSGIIDDVEEADRLGISYGEYKSRQRRGEIL